MQPVLQALKPYCLEFKGRLNGSLVFRHLASEPQRFVYLRLCALEADEPSFVSHRIVAFVPRTETFDAERAPQVHQAIRLTCMFRLRHAQSI